VDHLLAMVAVGLWSARALPVGRRGLGPLAFLVAMTLGAVAAAGGAVLPGVEAAIAASVLLMGTMLALARRLPVGPGLGLVAVAAVLHGLAHGSELPAGAGFAPYAAGFLLATAGLHVAGLALGLRFAETREGAWRVAGSLLAGAGLVLLFPA
ncbi:MAG TPA: HupE/UreJ family protein, partial [Burkholderiaceae bacterium]|nr:HupE/UreJ family protein [Burkholderiaceae bacterium]